MSQRKLRLFRRTINKRLQPQIEQAAQKLATEEFIRSTFKPKPRWMPMFAWKMVVNLVVKH